MIIILLSRAERVLLAALGLLLAALGLLLDHPLLVLAEVLSHFRLIVFHCLAVVRLAKNHVLQLLYAPAHLLARVHLLLFLFVGVPELRRGGGGLAGVEELRQVLVIGRLEQLLGVHRFSVQLLVEIGLHNFVVDLRVLRLEFLVDYWVVLTARELNAVARSLGHAGVPYGFARLIVDLSESRGQVALTAGGLEAAELDAVELVNVLL